MSEPLLIEREPVVPEHELWISSRRFNPLDARQHSSPLTADPPSFSCCRFKKPVGAQLWIDPRSRSLPSPPTSQTWPQLVQWGSEIAGC